MGASKISFRQGRMKILHTVEFYYPSIGGSQEVVRQLSERMVKMGHDVTVATTKLPHRESLKHNGVKIVEFDISGNTVNGIKGEKKKYQEFLKKSKFDAVMNYATQQWATDLFFDVIEDVSIPVKVLVPVGFSALYDERYQDYFKKMPELLKKYDATVYLAETYRDIDFAKEHGVNNIRIIPNGADENEFRDLDPHEIDLFKARYGVGGTVFITVGNHTAEKGHVEAIKAFKRLPILNATLIIAGSGKEDEGCYKFCHEQALRANNQKRFLGKRIITLDGSNRELVVQAMKASDIFVFFSNIEASPLVLFETVAAGVPFVASASGNNDEIAKWTGAGIIVKSHPRPNGRVEVDMKDSVIKLTRLSRNNKLRDQMGSAGRKTWQKKYTWEHLAEEYIDLYERVLKKKKA